MKLALSEIIGAIKGENLSPCNDAIISSISTDTRTITKGDGYLALSGERFDGNDFVFTAAENGAGLIILSDRSKGIELVERHPALPVVLVEDGLTALQELASYWRGTLSGTVVLITGSNGKTTTKELLASILRTKKQISVTPENKNNLIGLPQTLLKASREDEVIVLEAGMNHKGEILRLAEIAQPDIGIILNVAPAHIGHFSSIDAICDAKWELADGMGSNGTLLVNGNDPVLAKRAEQKENINLYGSGFEGVEVKDISVTKGGTAFTLLDGAEEIPFALKMIGRHFVSSLLAVVAVAKRLGFTTKEVAAAVGEFQGVKNRLSVRQEKNWEIINDAYNANPASMKAGIQAIHDIRNGIPTWYVLGDMGELGDASRKYHREIGDFIAGSIEQDERKPGFIFVGDMGKNIGEPIEEKYGMSVSLRYCPDYQRAVEILQEEKNGHTRVYLKASNSMHLYKIEEGLLN